MSGLDNMFNLKAHFNIFLRSSFNKFADSYTVENNEVLSVNHVDDSKFSGRSLMYIKKTSGPNIDT